MNLPIKISLPEGFLDEEVRCQYTISSKMKAVWAVELDLYHELDRVCKKYNLTLLADGGTILGAVRHSGFIPWDDDMDFSMTRRDYIKLCEVAESEFKYPYFWQTEETDPGSCRGHGQLRNSETTAILKSENNGKFTFNQGIFIDVFPFDNVPDQEEQRLSFLKQIGKFIKKKDLYRDLAFGVNSSKGLKKFAKNILINYYSDKKYNNIPYKQLEKLKTIYIDLDTECFANFLYVIESNPEALVRPKSWYSEYEEMPFENTSIKVPIGYDDYLRKAYGNWHKFEVNGSLHGDVFFDPYKSYKEYI